MDNNVIATVQQKYPDRVPVFIEREQYSNFAEPKRQKLLVPKQMTVKAFERQLRQVADISARCEVYLFSKSDYLLSQDMDYSMEDIYELHASEDGYLYVIYSDNAEISSEKILEATLSRLFPNSSIEEKSKIRENFQRCTSLELLAKYLNHTSDSIDDYLQLYNSQECASLGFISRCLRIASERFAKDHPQCVPIMVALLISVDLSWNDIQVLLNIDSEQVQQYISWLCDFGLAINDERQKNVSIPGSIHSHMVSAIGDDLTIMPLASLLLERFTLIVNCQNLVSLTQKCVSFPPADNEQAKTLKALALIAAETCERLQSWENSLKFYRKTVKLLQSIDEISDFSETEPLAEKLQELYILLGRFFRAKEVFIFRLRAMKISDPSDPKLFPLWKTGLKILNLTYMNDPLSQEYAEQFTEIYSHFAPADLAENPIFAIAHSYRAEFLLHNGDLANALVETQLAQSLSESSTDLGSDRLEIRLIHGKVLTAHENFVEAKFVLERVLLDYESIYGPNHPNLICVQYALYIPLYALSQYDKVENLLEKALSLGNKYFSPQHCITSMLYLFLLATKIDMEKYSEVLTLTGYLNQSEGSSQLQSTGAFFTVKALWFTGKFNEALSILQDYSKTSLDSSRGGYMGIFYALCGNFEAAQPYLDDLQRRKGETGIHNYFSNHCASIILNILGEYSEAMEFATEALKCKETLYSYPNHPVFLENLCTVGEIQTRLKNYSEALNVLNRALDIEESNFGPEFAVNALILLHIGFVHFKSGNYQDALSALTRSRKLIRLDAYYLPEVLLYTGCVLIELGRNNEALPLLQEASTLFREQGRFSLNLEHNKTLSSALLACGETTV
jgi:tetratricopeptide (TPR) repeat protein